MQQILNRSIDSKFIKALLYNTPLPMYKSVRDGDYILNGTLYVYKNSVIKCTKSGYIEKSPKGGFTKVSDYIFGMPYPSYTRRFMSNTSYFDMSTHKALGNYLRCMRDIQGINLMPMYNCFCGEQLYNKYFADIEIVDAPNKFKKVYLVPVNFNTTYTVAIDCPSEILIAPIFVKDNFLIQSIVDEEPVILTDLYIGEDFSKVTKYLVTSFKDPFTVHFDNFEGKNSTLFQNNERNLYMAIQLPTSNDSSLVVLEGDYSDMCYNNIINVPDISKISDADMDTVVTSKLSLLQFNSKENYVYPSRLMEYLLLHAITSEEKIYGNIGRIQYSLLNLYSNMNPDGFIKNVWTPEMRYKIYEYYLSTNGKKMDNFGYLDKDIESFLFR